MLKISRLRLLSTWRFLWHFFLGAVFARNFKMFGQLNYAFLLILGWKKIKKILGSSKIKNGPLIQDRHKNLIFF
jgi:hypothetical protein